MNSDSGFELHPEAALDISNIWEYIAMENPMAARRVREAILNTIRKLVLFPHQGRRRPDLTSYPLRFQTSREFLIAYAPDNKPLLVIAVLPGRQSPRVMAAMLRDRE